MKKLTIAIDVGDTLLNRASGKIVEMEGGRLTYPLFWMATAVLGVLKNSGHKLVIISKISKGDEAKVTEYLTWHHIVPELVKEENLIFCYEREEKGPIAENLGIDVIVDDRVQVHNAMAKYGVPHRILFLEGYDDRLDYALEISVLQAENWSEVLNHINNLSQ